METEKKTLFRKKSLDKLTSPEELSDYIRVAKPRIWITLGAIVALLLAGILWACFYTITRTVECGGYVYADYVYIYLSPDDYERIAEGNAVNIGGADYTVTLKAGMLSGATVYAEWSARGVSEADVNVDGAETGRLSDGVSVEYTGVPVIVTLKNCVFTCNADYRESVTDVVSRYNMNNMLKQSLFSGALGSLTSKIYAPKALRGPIEELRRICTVRTARK